MISCRRTRNRGKVSLFPDFRYVNPRRFENESRFSIFTIPERFDMPRPIRLFFSAFIFHLTHSLSLPFSPSFPFSLALLLALPLSRDALCAASDWECQTPKACEPATFSRPNDDALAIALKSENSLGQWNRTFSVVPEAGCRLTAEAEIELNADSDASQALAPGNDVMIIMNWMIPGNKNPIFQRDYVDFHDLPNSQMPNRVLRKFEQTFTVPAECTEMKVELLFKWRTGYVRFKNVNVEKTDTPKPRPVRVVAANPHTPFPATFETTLLAMEETLLNIFRNVENPDLIVFAEYFTTTGVDAPLEEKAEPIPGGRTFQLVSRYAKEHRVWIMANVPERSTQGTFHNTSFLVNRDGQLAGVYRKVHLTSSEFQKGVLPGKELPVFKTDFGVVGMLTCWDNWFSETAKILRRKGAEILLFPLAGDGVESHLKTIWSARAIDSAIPLVAVTQQNRLPSAIVDRDGTWLAQTTEKNGFAFCELDLAERKRVFWLSVGPALGDAHQLYLYESRPEVYSKK